MSDDIDPKVIEAACSAYNTIEDNAWEPAMRAALLAARPALVAAEREVCARVDQGYALAARLAEAEELASGH